MTLPKEYYVHFTETEVCTTEPVLAVFSHVIKLNSWDRYSKRLLVVKNRTLEQHSVMLFPSHSIKIVLVGCGGPCLSFQH